MLQIWAKSSAASVTACVYINILNGKLFKHSHLSKYRSVHLPLLKKDMNSYSIKTFIFKFTELLAINSKFYYITLAVISLLNPIFLFIRSNQW